MKLISLAALSLLAITVSAYPGLSTSPQSTTTQSAEQPQSTAIQIAEQPQSTDAQSAQKSQDAAERNAVRYQFYLLRSARRQYEQGLQAELQMLNQKYREEQDLAHDMGALLIAMESDQLELRGVADALDDNSLEQDKIMETLIAQASTMEEVRTALKATLLDMDKIMKNRSTVEGKLKLLS
ncbi:hypothetical protein BASA81_009447 [Batrachochytrium salamandrivorans]|nr:hypothetical protein BASA81_009447 [Batrachochytrium salamandrivorans]